MYLLSRLCLTAIGVMAGLALPLHLLWGVLLPLLVCFVLLRGASATLWLGVSVLAMALPLLLVHGVLNPQFPTAATIGPLNWRPAGAWHVVDVSQRLALLFAAVVVWEGVPRLTLVGLVVRSGLPAPLVLALAYSVALVGQLQRRVSYIHESLLSRGLFDGPRVRARGLALIAMTVPMIAIGLTEAVARSDARAGLGDVSLSRLKRAAPVPAFARHDMFAAAVLFVVSVAGALYAGR